MKKYILGTKLVNCENNAGTKAGSDVEKIVEKQGYQFVPLYVSKKNRISVGNILQGIWNTMLFCSGLTAGDYVLIQYPINRFLLKQIFRILKRKTQLIHVIILIHDIDYLRDISLGNQGVEAMKKTELELLANAEYLICHNTAMIKKLQEEQLNAKFISLEIFDYLYEGPSATISQDKNEVVVAGNLLEAKAGYLYKLENTMYKFKLALYGSNLSGNFRYENARYYGSFLPDELIENMQGAYGLVWDGTSLETCDGHYGRYLKLNNPHKVSLYLAAGMPVIVWKESALYPFVESNKVGFGIQSINELDIALEKNAILYDEYIENVKKIQKKIRHGAYLEAALSQIEIA